MIGYLRDLLFRDFWLKLFSLALAVLIWFTVASIRREGKDVSAIPAFSNNTVERTFYNLPVEVVATAADVRSFKVEPTEVHVRVRGEARLVEQLHAEDIHALVDLTGIEAARALTKRIQISTPPGITYDSVEPTMEAQVTVPPKW